MVFLGRNFRQWTHFQGVNTRYSYLQRFCANEDRDSSVGTVRYTGEVEAFGFICMSQWVIVVRDAFDITVCMRRLYGISWELRDEYNFFRFREFFNRPKNSLRVLKSEVSVPHPLVTTLSRSKIICIFTHNFLKTRVIRHPIYELDTQEITLS
jgi:hypothetical protein